MYIDMNQPYSDAPAACKLSGPKGACRFRTNHDTLSDGFVLTKVVPYFFNLLDEQVVLTLGKAVFESSLRNYIIIVVTIPV